MKKQIEKVEPFDERTGRINVVIETPKGSRVKYSYDPESGFFILSKAMPEGMMWPMNFGFIPQTLGEDGDPLDVLILNEEPLISGCLISVKPIAVIKATQTDDGNAIRNDRIIGQAIGKETPIEFQTLRLEKKVLAELEAFFVTYDKLYGKEFKVLGTSGAKKARQLIHQGVRLFNKKKKKE